MSAPVNPVLPEGFGETPNDNRPLSHQPWWDQPYIVTETHKPESYDEYRHRLAGMGYEPDYAPEEWDALQDRLTREWKQNFPSGTRYSVYCLDGGAWDRPTWWGDADTLEAAQHIANRVGYAWHSEETEQ